MSPYKGVLGGEEVGHLIRSAGWGGGGSPYKRMLGAKGMGHLVLGGAGGSHGMCYFKQWRRNPNVYLILWSHHLQAVQPAYTKLMERGLQQAVKLSTQGIAKPKRE